MVQPVLQFYDLASHVMLIKVFLRKAECPIYLKKHGSSCPCHASVSLMKPQPLILPLIDHESLSTPGVPSLARSPSQTVANADLSWQHLLISWTLLGSPQ